MRTQQVYGSGFQYSEPGHSFLFGDEGKLDKSDLGPEILDKNVVDHARCIECFNNFAASVIEGMGDRLAKEGKIIGMCENLIC